jgi:hypothetical protein
MMSTPELERYLISGVVQEEETGRPLANLIVRGYDRDLVFDDNVGNATTDRDGRFEIRFGPEQFRDLREEHPDLYLKIYDQSGTRLIHQTSDAIRWGASRDEAYEIRIPARALAGPHPR